MNSHDRAKQIIERYEVLARIWRDYEPEVAAISKMMNPRQQHLSSTQTPHTKGFMRGVYSSLPIVYMDKITSQLFSTMVNPANRWFGLTIPDKDLASFKPVRDWLWMLTSYALVSFGTGRSTFYQNAIPLLADDVGFGNGLQFQEYEDGRERINDMTVPPGKAVIGRDADGQANEFMYLFSLRAEQAVRKFGREMMPRKIVEHADKPGDSTEFWFILSMSEADRYEDGRMGAEGKPWRSVVVAKDEPDVVYEGGFFDRPFDAPMWRFEANATYARGLGYTAYAAARGLNVTKEATLTGAQFAAKPVNLAASERVLPRGRKIRPGTTLYGAIVGGRRNFEQLGASGSIGLTVEHQDREMDELREALHGTLFHLQGRTGVGDREWFDQHANQLQQLAPYLTNFEAMYLQPKIGKRVSMILRMGLVGAPPQELDGQPLELEMQSAASLALRASDGAATMQLMQDIQPLAALGPEALARAGDRLDVDAALETLQAARGVPSRVLRSREEADALSAARAEQAALAQAAEAAPGVAGAVRDLAEIEAA